MTESTQSSWAT